MTNAPHYQIMSKVHYSIARSYVNAGKLTLACEQQEKAEARAKRAREDMGLVDAVCAQ